MRKKAPVSAFVPFFSLFFCLMLTSTCLAMDYEEEMAWLNRIFDKGESLPPKSKENAKTMHISKSEAYFYGLRITEDRMDDSAFVEHIFTLGGKKDSLTGDGGTLAESLRVYRNIANGNVVVLIEEGYRGTGILAFYSKGKTRVVSLAGLRVLPIKDKQYLLYSVGSCFGEITQQQSMAERSHALRVAVFDGKGFVSGKIGQHQEVYQMLIADVLEKQKKWAADKVKKAWAVPNPALEIAFYKVMMGEDPKKVTKELTAALPKKYKSKIKSAMDEILATARDTKSPGFLTLEGKAP